MCCAGLAAQTLVACTPKPVDAQPVVEDVIAALEANDVSALDGLVDDPTAAGEAFTATFNGLQAEGLDIELTGVEQDDTVATANYAVHWDLPKDRALDYDTSMTLTKVDDTWTGRWQPSMIYPKLGANQHLELRAVPAKRASVVSSDGVELMRPGLQYRLVVDTDAVADVRPLAARISSALAAAHEADDSVALVDASDLANRLDEAEGNYSVGVYSEKVGPQLRDELAGATGVRMNEEPALIVRDNGFARDLMARVSRLVDEDTMGESGWTVSVVNQNGAALTDIERQDPDPAPAIRVGIDYDVQRAAEEAVNQRAGSEAMMVAIRPSTGEILAVAQTDEADKRGDLALSGQFPPGSVFKIITAAAGLDRQDLSSDTIVPCPGTMDIYGRIVTNYNGFSLGSVPLGEAFAQSCNTTFANISTNLDQGVLKEEAKRFGVGMDYNIPGLTTVTGQVPEGTTPLERTEAGYGQGLDLVSPFGMALASATVAAGKTPVPSLVATEKTEVTGQAEPPSPYMLDNLRGMMRQVVTSGTARGMQAQGEIYGKTGEAEINEGSHAWFTGYRGDLAFATLVVLGGGSQTSVAITDSFFQNLDRLRSDPRADAPATDPNNEGDIAAAP